MQTYKIKINDTDISDYVLSCSEVPVIERNRNWEPIISEIDMILGKSINSLIVIDNVIKISFAVSETYPFFIGYIFEHKYDYDNRVYNVKIRSIMGKLEQYKMTGHNLVNVAGILSGTDLEYKNPDNEGYAGLQLIWIIRRFIESIGYATDIPKDTFIENVNISGPIYPINLEHLRVDYFMLRNIGQEKAYRLGELNTNSEIKGFIPTFFDFFKWFCAKCPGGDLTGFNIMWSTPADGDPEVLMFKLRDNQYLTINDDIIYSLEEDIVRNKKESGYRYVVRFAYGRAKYYDDVTDDLSEWEYSDGDSENEIEIQTHLIMMYESYWDSSGRGNTLGIGAFPDFCYPHEFYAQNYINELLSTHESKEYVTEAVIPSEIKSIKLFAIDLNANRAKVIEEVVEV